MSIGDKLNQIKENIKEKQEERKVKADLKKDFPDLHKELKAYEAKHKQEMKGLDKKLKAEEKQWDNRLKKEEKKADKEIKNIRRDNKKYARGNKLPLKDRVRDKATAIGSSMKRAALSGADKINDARKSIGKPKAPKGQAR